MAKLTRSEQIIAEKTVCILLVRGENVDKQKIYAYVALRADKLEEFLAAQKSGVFYPEEYGIVLASGEGEPDEETRTRMTKEYGFNHNTMLDIPDPAKAHDIASHITQYSTKPEA